MLTPPGRNGNGRHTTFSMVLVAGLLASLLPNGTWVSATEPPRENTLGQPGYLVIEAARDSSVGFRWEVGPSPAQRTLVWDQGRLILPDSLPVDPFGKNDLGVQLGEHWAGSGDSGQMVFVDGIFPVSEPVVLSDGLVELEISDGELEIRGARIRYRRAETAAGDFRSGLLLLAGMTLMVFVLVRRARLKVRERAGT